MSPIESTLISNSLPLPQSSDSGEPLMKVQGRGPAAVAQDFEGLFASMLLKEMRQTLEPGSFLGEDSSDVYGGLFDRFMGQQMTLGTGLGLAPMVRKALERQLRSDETLSATDATKSMVRQA